MKLADGICVAVIAAMTRELQPIVKRLGLTRVDCEFAPVHRGRVGSRTVVTAATSMGTEAAALVTAQVLDAFAVDHVVVVGVAGGIGEHVRVGDLVNPQAAVDERSGQQQRPTPLSPEPPSGKLLTSDILHDQPGDVARLRRDGFVAVDMETAAIAAVAEAREIRWSVFRAISDMAGDGLLDAALVAATRNDGTPDPAAMAAYVLRRPWRIPKLIRLGQGSSRAIRASTDAVLRTLDPPQ